MAGGADIAFNIAGTGTASGKVVDKVTMSATTSPQLKHLFAIEGNVLFTSLLSSYPNDADGYPTEVDLNRPWTR